MISKTEFENLANNANPTVTKLVGTFQAYNTTQKNRTMTVNGVDPHNP